MTWIYAEMSDEGCIILHSPTYFIRYSVVKLVNLFILYLDALAITDTGTPQRSSKLTLFSHALLLSSLLVMPLV